MQASCAAQCPAAVAAANAEAISKNVATATATGKGGQQWWAPAECAIVVTWRMHGEQALEGAIGYSVRLQRPSQCSACLLRALNDKPTDSYVLEAAVCSAATATACASGDAVATAKASASSTATAVVSGRQRIVRDPPQPA